MTTQTLLTEWPDIYQKEHIKARTYMGHQNTSITLNRYSHCMLDHKMEMMQKLPRIL